MLQWENARNQFNHQVHILVIPLFSQIIPKSKLSLSIHSDNRAWKAGPPSTHPLCTSQGLLTTAGTDELCISCLSFQLEVVSKWAARIHHPGLLSLPSFQHWICTFLLIYSPGNVCCSFSTAWYRQSHRNTIKSLSSSARRSFPPSLPAPGPHRFQKIQKSQQSAAQQGHKNKPRARGGEENGHCLCWAGRGKAQSPPKCRPRAPQTPAPMGLGAGKPGCLKRLQSWQSPAAFQGAAMSADSLCKAFYLQKKKARETHCLLLSSK